MPLKTATLLLMMTCASVYAQQREFYRAEAAARERTPSDALAFLPAKEGEGSADLQPASQSSRTLYSATRENGWSREFSVPGVVDGPVYAMTSDGANLYVGGQFSVAGGAILERIHGRPFHGFVKRLSLIKFRGREWSP